MVRHNDININTLRRKIRQGEIAFGGNRKLKIYGRLQCVSGKRMKPENRVFFVSGDEAKKNGFRPCGHCMKKEYENWKVNGTV